MKVRSYDSGEEFRRNATPLPNDCLIIDIDMPGASGIELLHQLRNYGVTIPAMFLTGRAITDEIRVAAQRLNAVVFEKPMLPQELMAAVRAALG